MEINKYILVITAAAVGLVSCKKSFLNETPPTAVPIAQAIVTPNDLADAVNGMYSAAKSSSLFGRDVPVLGDELADNIYVSSSNSGRYLTENNYSFVNTNGEASDIYIQGYYTILQANRIIAANVPASNDVSQLKGEAYIMRGLVNLTMVTFFGPAYSVSSTAPGIPVVTLPENATGAYVQPARASVDAVYKQIISDLDSAYLIMPTNGTTLHATNSEFLSKYAAKAIEARAYLYKGDYANAITAGLLVVQNGGYTLSTSQTAFNSYWASPGPVTNKAETIFELANTATSNNGTNGLDAIYWQLNSAYGDLLATDDLYNQYTATDWRKSLIVSGTRGGNQAYECYKYQNYANSADKDDLKIIRYAEVLLTLGEAYAQTGDNVNGQLYLNQVAKNRDPSFLGYTDLGAALATDALNERRKELAFEGLRWFDLKRLNLVINRPQEGTKSYPSYPTVSLTDFRRLLPIPLGAINANPSLTQNNGY